MITTTASDGRTAAEESTGSGPIGLDAVASIVRRRRSVRSYDADRNVPDAALEALVDVARWAPSGANAQPWEFVAVRDADMRHRIVELYLEQLDQKRVMEELVRGDAQATTGNVGFRQAPVLLVILYDPRVADSFPVRTLREKGRDHLMSSMAHATLLLHLAATAMGLATQWVSDASSPYMSTVLKEWLGVPAPLEVYDMMPVGHPRGKTRATPRRSTAELLHHDRYQPALARDDHDVERFLWEQTRLGAFGARSRP